MYSEDFLFMVLGTCLGAILAALGGIGCFLLALFGKDESTGEVRVGKFLNVKGVSLIMMSICGVALMGVCVFAWFKMRSHDGEMVSVESWDDDTWWAEDVGDDDSAFTPAFESDVIEPASEAEAIEPVIGAVEPFRPPRPLMERLPPEMRKTADDSIYEMLELADDDSVDDDDDTDDEEEAFIEALIELDYIE
jgi:hypothetical protein